MFGKVVWIFKTAPSRRVFAFFINLYIRGTCSMYYHIAITASVVQHRFACS